MILTIIDCFYWTDFEVTISCIKSEGKVFKIFVENRVCEIYKNTDVSKWLYCEAKHNSIDLLTRPKNLEFSRKFILVDRSQFRKRTDYYV